MKPRQAVKNWHIGNIAKLYPVKTGIFNEAHIVRTNTGVYVMQKLHPLISRREHNLARALGQIALYKSFRKKIGNKVASGRGAGS
jgi:hypothetical protein